MQDFIRGLNELRYTLQEKNSDRGNNFKELKDGSQLVTLMKNKEVSDARGDIGGEFRKVNQIMDRDRLLL